MADVEPMVMARTELMAIAHAEPMVMARAELTAKAGTALNKRRWQGLRRWQRAEPVAIARAEPTATACAEPKAMASRRSLHLRTFQRDVVRTSCVCLRCFISSLRDMNTSWHVLQVC